MAEVKPPAAVVCAHQHMSNERLLTIYADSQMILFEALREFADPKNWAVSRRYATPEHIWIGSVYKHPSKIAQEAYDVAMEVQAREGTGSC